ncbi:hypothetical protein MSHI_16910 [Mycobacterium shinjukuense]|uniref:GAP family protein n=2 Tax=Mycobacterium shinjukuense TaxID=398694 RepID=A0A7I7MNR2_9MYCO|nr:hypothetical protein MSHI_16910 [Mycobacterium shinjukuense]
MRTGKVTSPVMWAAVLYIGLVMATDPIRFGLALVLVTRRRPMLNLLAFWLGGLVAGIALAVAVLVVMRDVALTAIQAAASAITEVRSSVVILTGGRLQITVGVIVLMVAANLVARQRTRARVPIPVGGAGGLAPQPDRPGPIARMGAVTKNMLTGALWPAFVAGLASSAPPIESVTALTIIMASGAAIGTQVSAFLVFILLVLTVIEIPLVTYLVIPQQTEAAMLRLDNWLRTHRRRITLTMLVVTGAILLVQGVAAL